MKTTEQIQTSTKNLNLFKARYGHDMGDEQIDLIYKRFNAKKAGLTNKDILAYSNTNDLIDIIRNLSDKDRKTIFTPDGQYRTLEMGEDVQSNKRVRVLHNIMRAIYGKILDEDIDNLVCEYNKKFSKSKNSNDLLHYSNVQSIKDDVFTQDSEDRVIIEDPETRDGSEYLLKDDEVLLVKITNYAESKRFCHDFGNKAQWCISYENSSTHWDTYTKDGKKFIFLLLRSGEKFAITYIEGAHEIYDTRDTLASAFMLAHKYPQIVDILQENGVKTFKHKKDYDVKEFKLENCNGFEVEEVFDQSIGGLSGKFTSYLDENYEYLDGEIHNHPAIRIG